MRGVSRAVVGHVAARGYCSCHAAVGHVAVPHGLDAQRSISILEGEVLELKTLVNHANHYAFAREGCFKPRASMHFRCPNLGTHLIHERFVRARTIYIEHLLALSQHGNERGGDSGRKNAVGDRHRLEALLFHEVSRHGRLGTVDDNACERLRRDALHALGSDALHGAPGNECVQMAVPFLAAFGDKRGLC